MILATHALLLIVQLGPGAEPPCAVGKLMERLQHELRTGQSPMNPYRFTTTFRYRRLPTPHKAAHTPGRLRSYDHLKKLYCDSVANKNESCGHSLWNKFMF